MARRMLMCTITKRNKLCKYCNTCINTMIKMKRPGALMMKILGCVMVERSELCRHCDPGIDKWCIEGSKLVENQNALVAQLVRAAAL